MIKAPCLNPGRLVDNTSVSKTSVCTGDGHGDEGTSDYDDDCSFGSYADLEGLISSDAMPLPDGQHKGAPLPINETERVRFLQELSILDSLEEESFDGITRAVSKIFDVPIALVGLIDQSRQWFKSVVGLDITEAPREHSFCAHLLLPEEPEILLVPDATLDPRFCNNPLVIDEPFIRFYCGAPVIVEGVRLGSLCIIDRVPRTNVDPGAAFLLTNLADIVAGLIEKNQNPLVQHFMIDHPSFLVEASDTNGMAPIRYTNVRGKGMVGDPYSDDKNLLDLITLEEADIGLRTNEPRVHAAMFKGEGDQEIPCLLYVHPASKQIRSHDRGSTVACPWSLNGRAVMKYNFAIIKLDNKVPDYAPPSRWTDPASNVLPIRTAEELKAAAQQGPIVVLFTSMFCATCTHFADFYRMAVNMSTKQDRVRFYSVSVDDSADIVRSCCSGATRLPMVQFYEGTNVSQVPTEHWAKFRQEVMMLTQTAGRLPSES
jgi:hypothetical protein